MASLHWEAQILDKRTRQKASIPQDWLIDVSLKKDNSDVSYIPHICGLLSSRELEITGTTDVSVLLQKIARAEWSSVDVTRAFCKRAVIAHQLVSHSSHFRCILVAQTDAEYVMKTNCLTEIFIEQALDRASKLDAYLREHGKVIGPLHGLPISLKDPICVKGIETTMGTCYHNNYAHLDDSHILSRLCGMDRERCRR